MSVSDVARELGIRWKNAPVELKAKYEQAASEKKNVYQAEMAIYKHQTSNGSSPPETPQTPLTPHDYQPILFIIIFSSTHNILNYNNYFFNNNKVIIHMIMVIHLRIQLNLI